ncbi:MAG: site-specific integrase [Syntrophorhabdaceae bacterium]|jgi:integrase|nr:site-specific integrase [Syntrophorhabdaceae bacterium]HNQ64186.1 hypothetical protein [Syntrophorhabdaceae bacterium]
MRGGIGYQITEIFNKSGIFQPGTSKHVAKAQSRANGRTNSHQVGKDLYIYSYATAMTYKDVWHRFGKFIKAALDVYDIEKVAELHVREYLEHRINCGISHETYKVETAALHKLEKALNLYSDKFGKGNKYDFEAAIESTKDIAREELLSVELSRAYENPEELLENIAEEYMLASKIQFLGGARISEATLILMSQCKGLVVDPVTLEVKGSIELTKTKGGRRRNIMVDRDTYNLLLEHMTKNNGVFRVSKAGYINEVKKACRKAGEEYHGPHGLRWNFAADRMVANQQSGHTYEQALVETANQMGHSRGDITEHYLK